MSTYRLDLVFLETPDDALPGPPLAYVGVKAHSVSGYKGSEGVPLITTEAVSLTEFEYQIDELKRELDEIKAKARRKFQQARKREEERFAKRKSS